MLSGNRAAHLFDRLYCRVCCFLHTLSQDNRVCACRQVLHAFMNHSLCQNRCGGCTITCYIVGLGRYLSYQLSAHVLKRILKLDLFCDGHTIICDKGCAVLLIQYYVSSLWSDCYSYGIRKLINSSFQCFSGLYAVFDFLSHF